MFHQAREKDIATFSQFDMTNLYLTNTWTKYFYKNGARGRNRTGTPLQARDFLTNYYFRSCIT
jgi:hypothetical protein